MGHLGQRLAVSFLGVAAGVSCRLRGPDRREWNPVDAEHAALVVEALQLGHQRGLLRLLRFEFVGSLDAWAGHDVARINRIADLIKSCTLTLVLAAHWIKPGAHHAHLAAFEAETKSRTSTYELGHSLATRCSRHNVLLLHSAVLQPSLMGQRLAVRLWLPFELG